MGHSQAEPGHRGDGQIRVRSQVTAKLNVKIIFSVYAPKSSFDTWEKHHVKRNIQNNFKSILKEALFWKMREPSCCGETEYMHIMRKVVK
jgi:hypothetical protein